MVNVVKLGGRSRLFILACASLFMVACGGIDVDDRQLVERAKGYLEKNDVNAAAIELRNALQSNPGNAEARYLLGRISLNFGDFPTAAKSFQIAAQGRPGQGFLAGNGARHHAGLACRGRGRSREF